MTDFTGMATVYGVPCSDGRTIQPGAFDHQEGQTVPLVWRHDHGKITNIIGHGVLSVSQSPPGIRVTGTFNSTKEGRQAKQLVDSRDITNLSIWANEVMEHTMMQHDKTRREVKRGTIREVSLVLTGANPGALIDDYVRHSDDPLAIDGLELDGIIIHTDEFIVPTDGSDPEPEEVEETEEEETEEEGAVDEDFDFDDEDDDDFDWDELYSDEDDDELDWGEIDDDDEELTDEEFEAFIMGLMSVEDSEFAIVQEDDDVNVLMHQEGTVADILQTLNPDQWALFDVVMHSAAGSETLSRSERITQTGPTVQEVFDSLSPEQKNTLYFLAGSLQEEEPIQQGDLNTMRKNIFEDGIVEEDNILSHEDVQNVLLAAADRRTGTMREWFEKADIVITHSITDVAYLFPDASPAQPGGPEFYSRPMEWVEKVLNATKTRPFSRIKTWYTDLTPDAARAKGYVTGEQKAEEVVAILKRTTTPQTIYKLQKLDRDDILDITEFDVVVWLKAEMRLMLREELARAILISDGRSGASADKIVETNIRPIMFDNDVYTVKHYHNDVGNEQALSAFTDAELIDLVDNIASSMIQYRGSGSPTFYCSPEVRSRLMLIRDTQGRRLHPSLDALAAALGVSAVMEIPVMSGLVTEDSVNPTGLPAGTYDIAHLGIIVNLNDYVIGMDRGGQTSFFDDFDLNYNKYEYLYEARCSGALIHPYSAIAVNLVTAKTA